MTDTEALLKASVRERRRIFLMFTVLLVLVAAALGLGWLGSAIGRDSWHEQAMTWQTQYVELYDEFTATTGEEPAAPDPAVVADEGPPASRAPPVPSARPAPAGKDGRPGLDSTVPGPAGPPGADSTVPGPQGVAGRDGQDSTIPGPQGAQGPQGPAGADGRGIQSLYCDDTTGRWTVTYTDTTTADAGVCRTTILEGVIP